MLTKLKSWVLDDTIYIAVLLVLVAFVSFGLGRLSVTESVTKQPFVGQTALQPATVIQAEATSTVATSTKSVEVLPIAQPLPSPVQNYVASKSGTKYHAMHCPGAKQIKETNKIFFQSEQEAEAAGYTRAANCKF